MPQCAAFLNALRLSEAQCVGYFFLCYCLFAKSTYKTHNLSPVLFAFGFCDARALQRIDVKFGLEGHVSVLACSPVHHSSTHLQSTAISRHRSHIRNSGAAHRIRSAKQALALCGTKRHSFKTSKFRTQKLDLLVCLNFALFNPKLIHSLWQRCGKDKN